MPGVFPVAHPRFWINGVLPWIIVAGTLSGRLPRGRLRETVRLPALAALAALWTVAAISARITFPVTFGSLWVVPLLAGIVIGWLSFAESRRGQRPRFGVVSAAAAMAAAIGIFLPVAQRTSPPDTRPSNIEIRTLQVGAAIPSANEAMKLSDTVEVFPNEGTVVLGSRKRKILVQPLLTFQSRSPDGCWTLFANGKVSRGPRRELIHSDRNAAHAKLSYRDDNLTSLEVDAGSAGRVAHIEATSRLPLPVWSHLNSYAELAITGRGALSVSFSPCPDTRIEVRSMDYPFGRPARFAYLDMHDVFHVVEARSAEKGPFRQLAAGHLSKDAPLEMIFFDDGAPVFRVALADWASQTGRQISPTAGWGVPVNAIEFSLQADSIAHVFVTLAATSVGRGFESVGHAAGVYRNRMSIEQLAD